MTLTTKAINTINDKMAKATSQFVDFTMFASNEVVSVEPWINGTYNVYFNAYNQNCTVKSVAEVADLLLTYPAKAVELANEEQAWLDDNMPKLRKFFKENFEGKTWEEIRSNEDLYESWGFYSDWHKDCYGYRPHGIVCGVYINPHA